MPDPGAMDHPPIPAPASPAALTVSDVTIAGTIRNTSIRLCNFSSGIMSGATSSFVDSVLQLGGFTAVVLGLGTATDSQVEVRGGRFNEGGIGTAGDSVNSTFIVAAVVIKRNHTGTVAGIAFGGSALGSAWVLVTDVNVTVSSFGSAAQAFCVSFVGVIARVVVANSVIMAASGSIASGVIAFNASRPTSSITVVNVTGTISAQTNARFIEVSNCWACQITVANVTVDQGHGAYATLGLDSMWQPSSTFQTLQPVAPLGTAFGAMVGIFSSRGAIDVTVTEARCVLSANVTAQVLIAGYSDSGAEAVPPWVVDSPLYRSPVTGARRSTVMNVTVSSSSARVVPWQFDPASEVDAGRLADAVDRNSGPTAALPYPFGLPMVTFLVFQVATKDVSVPVKEEVHMALHRCEAIVQGTADDSGAISAMFISGIDADNATVAVTDTTFVAAMDAAGHVALARICERGFSGEAIDVRGNRLVAGLPFLGDRETLAALFFGVLGPSALPPSEYNVSRAKTSVAKSQGIVTKLNRVSGTFHVHGNVVTTTATVLQCIVASATAARANTVLIASNVCRHVGVEAFTAASAVVIVSHISHVETVAFVGNTVDILHTEATTILPLSLRYINGSVGTVLFGNNTVRVRHIHSMLTAAQVTRIQRSQSIWSLYVDLIAAGRATVCRMAVVGNVLDATPVFLTAASVMAGFSYGVSFYLDRRDFDCAWWDPTFPPALMDVLSESDESVVTALSTNSVLLQNNTAQAKTWALRLGIPPGPLIAVRNNTVYHVVFGLFITNTVAWREGSLLSVTGNAFISRGSAARGLIVHQVRTPYDYTLTSALANGTNPSDTEIGNLPRLYEIRRNTFSLLYLPSAALSAADKTRCRTEWAQGNVAVEVRPTAALHGTISNATIDVSDNRVVLAHPFVGVAFCAASFFVVTAAFARSLTVTRNVAVGIPQGAFFRVETMGIVASGGTAPSFSSTAIPAVVVTRKPWTTAT